MTNFTVITTFPHFQEYHRNREKIKSSLYGFGGKSYKPLVETRTVHFARPKAPSRHERIFTNSAAITRIGNAPNNVNPVGGGGELRARGGDLINFKIF